jgi:Tfp pilus assembly pilus retraction ATPase PilT
MNILSNIVVSKLHDISVTKPFIKKQIRTNKMRHIQTYNKTIQTTGSYIFTQILTNQIKLKQNTLLTICSTIHD